MVFVNKILFSRATCSDYDFLFQIAVTTYKALCCLSVTETGEVFIWGKGRAGRLGHGDTRDR